MSFGICVLEASLRSGTKGAIIALNNSFKGEFGILGSKSSSFPSNSGRRCRGSISSARKGRVGCAGRRKLERGAAREQHVPDQRLDGRFANQSDKEELLDHS